MTNDKRQRVGSVATQAAGQDAWSLEGERLSRRVPRFAAFVEATEDRERALTDTQKEFLDEFSSELTEAISEERGGLIAKDRGDKGTT